MSLINSSGVAWQFSSAYNGDSVVFNYNFVRIHQTLRVTPAMEAGLADHVWEFEEILSLLK